MRYSRWLVITGVLQVDGDDALGLFGDVVVLKVVTERGAIWVRWPLGGEDLAAVARLLCGALVAEVLQLGVEAAGNNTGRLPAGVEVVRVRLGCDEAAV
jgi:hypothetical protein